MGIKRSDLSERVQAQIAAQEKCADPYISKTPTKDGARTKYGNSRTYCEIIGRTFDSLWERTVARRLWARQQAGEISDLTFQVTVDLLGCVRMRPDFQYVEDGVLITHEAKGLETPQYRLQRKLWEVVGPTEYRISYQKKADMIIFPEPSKGIQAFVARQFVRDYGPLATLQAVTATLEDAE